MLYNMTLVAGNGCKHSPTFLVCFSKLTFQRYAIDFGQHTNEQHRICRQLPSFWHIFGCHAAVFAYQTVKLVKTSDMRLTIMKSSFVILFSLYIIIELLAYHSYFLVSYEQLWNALCKKVCTWHIDSSSICEALFYFVLLSHACLLEFSWKWSKLFAGKVGFGRICTCFSAECKKVCWGCMTRRRRPHTRTWDGRCIAISRSWYDPACGPEPGQIFAKRMPNPRGICARTCLLLLISE